MAIIVVRKTNPIKYIKNYENLSRSMDFWTDLVDGLGGYPYEFASVEEIKSFFLKRNFKVVKIKKSDGYGCNEFLFMKLC
ncbi:hypothetical protein [Methanocaldococcus infernus]|uniref:hypothetical protein n=1 Tax=Methanocaldococcus infernus TaxID=67760 RepID=UPI00064F717C|nr:hypothetical protein [Methanocaldococcus infernus]